MPYKDPQAQRDYQRKWRQQRRDEFLLDKACIRCGAIDDLQLHHRNKGLKVSHKIWSWSEERRAEEIEKCDILCGDCHRAIHAPKHGTPEQYKTGCRCQPCRDDHWVRGFNKSRKRVHTES